MKKLEQYHQIEIISPSANTQRLGDSINLAEAKLKNLGYGIKYGNNFMKCNSLMTSSIEERISDLHAAFMNSNTNAILTSI